MKTLFLCCVLVLTFIGTSATSVAQITSPTSTNIYYPGDTITVRWDPSQVYGAANITLFQGEKIPPMYPVPNYIGLRYYLDNTGLLTWVVPTNINVAADFYRVQIVGQMPYWEEWSQPFQIRFGKTRPAKLVLKAERSIYLSWQAIWGHDYEIQASAKADWKNPISLGTINAYDEDMGITVIASEGQYFFRAVDRTP